jgi:hypothetical protein
VSMRPWNQTVKGWRTDAAITARELDHDRASLGVASFGDAQITAHRAAALEMGGSQTDIGCQLLAIVERAVEHLAD